MKINRKFLSIAILCLAVFLILPQKLCAINADELASICEAMESSIHDITVEYEWYVDPPLTPEYLAGMGGGFIAKGRPKYQWSTAIPFADRSLRTEIVVFMNKDGKSWPGTRKQSYNGKIAKYLEIYEPTGHPKMTGTLSKSKRFMPDRALTPEGFSILRFHDDLISTKLRRSDQLVLDTNVETVGEFATVRADFMLPSRGVPYLRVYFSVDHGYTPVRFEYMKNDKVSSFVNVTSLEKVSDGLWYPKSGRVGRTQDKHHNVYTASKVIVNQGLDDDHFDIEFPPGTKVIDEITNMEYIIRPTESQFNEWLENQEAIYNFRKRQTPILNSPKSSPVSQDAELAASDTLDQPKQILAQESLQSKEGRSWHGVYYVLIASLMILFGVLLLKRYLYKE